MEGPSQLATTTAGHEKTSINSDPEHRELQPFPILKLPWELRNQIWRFALVRPRGVFIVVNKALAHRQCALQTRGQSITFYDRVSKEAVKMGRFRPKIIRDTDKKLGHINLFFVNRQVHFECIPIYYSQNVFYFHNTYLWPSKCLGSVPEAVAFFSFLGNRYAQGIPRLQDIELDLLGRPLPYDVTSFASVSSINSALPLTNLQTLHINANRDGLSSFIRLLTDCFPNSGAGRVKTTRVEWFLGMEDNPDYIPWRSICKFMSRVRLLRNMFLNNNGQRGYAGITVLFISNDNLSSHRTRITRKWPHFYPYDTFGSNSPANNRSLIFEWNNIGENKHHSSPETTSSDKDGGQSSQTRDIRKLAKKLVWRTRSKGPLNLADWSSELEEFEEISGVNQEFVHSDDRRPTRWDGPQSPQAFAQE